MSRRRSRAARRSRKAGKTPWLAGAALIVLSVAALLWKGGGDSGPERSSPAVDLSGLPALPEFTMEDMEPQVVAALEAARQAVAADPGSVTAWGEYGILLDAHDLHIPAVVCYRAARMLDASAFEWPYLLARALEVIGGEADEYLPLLEEAVAKGPAYAPVHVRRGSALLRAGLNAEAEASFAEAVAIAPGLAVAHRGLGRARLAQGDAEGARQPLERAISLEPEDGAAWGFLARVLARVGERDAARHAQARARELDAIHVYPDPVLARIGDAGLSADQCLRRGRERLEKGDLVRAVRDLEKARSARPEDPVARNLLAGAYGLSGRDAEAIEEYRKALALREEYPSAHRDLATVLIRHGRFSEALGHYRRAEELAEPDADLVSEIASALAQTGDLPGALAEFERASRVGDLSGRAQLNWGTAWAQSGDLDRAARHFQEAVRLEPGLANAWGNLGAARESLGDRDGAREAYRRALEIDPRHRVAGALARLEG